MNEFNIEELTKKISSALEEEGFDIFGFAMAEKHPEDAEHIRAWTSAGRNGSMSFFERSSEKRGDITTLVDGARSVIIAGLKYFSEDLPSTEKGYFISRYARVRDYHLVMKRKLGRVADLIDREVPQTVSRAFCDSDTVTEKEWAIRAGLGWRGRNSIIINEKTGSFFFLGGIVTTADLAYTNTRHEDRCGTCSLCIEACPTGAICNDRTIDARRCIAYLTIEHKGKMPDELRGNTENIIFGCDRCQEVCPWNRDAKPWTNDELKPDFDVTSLTRNDWQTMTPGRFELLFRSSPIKRTGLEKMKRNIEFTDSALPEKR